MIVVWHMLILYAFTSPKYLTQDPKPKFQYFRFCKFWFFRTSQCPVDRHSTGTRPACTILCMCVSVDRDSTDTLPAPNLLLSGNASRPTQSTGEPQRSDFWPLAVDRPGRPAVCQKFWQTQQLYFLTLWLLGFVSNESLEQFLTPINRWSLHMKWLMILELSSEIWQVLWKDFPKFSKEKIFLQSLNFHHLSWSLFLYFSLVLHYTIPYSKSTIWF